MADHALSRYPARSELPRWILSGAICGAFSMLVFHQGVAAVLHAWAVIPDPPHLLAPERPLGLPILLSMTLWGAAWGALLAASLGRLRGATLIFASAALGAVLPTLAAWLVAAPLTERAVPLGIGLILHGAWGLGSGLGLALLGRRRA